VENIREKKLKSKSFESSLLRLEKIVEKLEEGNIPLEESLKLFEEGMKLLNFCEETLKNYQVKIEKLVSKEGNSLKTEPFKLDGQSSSSSLK
jgi:exodeoxyribonuclease VII small subunit